MNFGQMRPQAAILNIIAPGINVADSTPIEPFVHFL
jgi:hypothetical protein